MRLNTVGWIVAMLLGSTLSAHAQTGHEGPSPFAYYDLTHPNGNGPQLPGSKPWQSGRLLGKLASVATFTNLLTVTAQDGSVMQIKLDSNTMISRVTRQTPEGMPVTEKVKLASLKPGEDASILGMYEKPGVFHALSIWVGQVNP